MAKMFFHTDNKFALYCNECIINDLILFSNACYLKILYQCCKESSGNFMLYLSDLNISEKMAYLLFFLFLLLTV